MLIDPKTVILGENFLLWEHEKNLEHALATRCLHRFGPWTGFARGGRRWCLDCKGAEVQTPGDRYRRIKPEVNFYPSGHDAAREVDFKPESITAPFFHWGKK